MISLDDILNVRLQTLGVMEHSFPVSLAGKTYHWKLYDVGGAVSDFNSTFDGLIFTPFSVDRCVLYIHLQMSSESESLNFLSAIGLGSFL